MSLNEEKGFLAAIDADSADKTARLVYADWLQERGLPKMSFVRKEVELMEKFPQHSIHLLASLRFANSSGTNAAPLLAPEMMDALEAALEACREPHILVLDPMLDSGDLPWLLSQGEEERRKALRLIVDSRCYVPSTCLDFLLIPKQPICVAVDKDDSFDLMAGELEAHHSEYEIAEVSQLGFGLLVHQFATGEPLYEDDLTLRCKEEHSTYVHLAICTHKGALSICPIEDAGGYSGYTLGVRRRI
jgi:uncharacterized protein (TIGR02996 family)